ncbi:MAG TPA: type V CRISPR-associated protein Cas12b, partial [Bryobacteraceae bacterium]|nr:type V CRISPR-associated protein Cas12b [Bryobacteraceae bacterium]
MAGDGEIALTQRAYTLRLRPAITKADSPEDIRKKARELQDALWATHEAVNRGAKAFGDWLLTLRGGLDHRLADEKIKVKKSGEQQERDPTLEERRNRRILLALSWLSVEDERGAPADSDVMVAYGDRCSKQRDNQDARNCKVIETLRKILKARGVPEDEIGQPEATGTWLGDCNDSLSAAIRDDAVWVNRSALFDRIPQQWNALDKAREDAWTILAYLLGEEFLTVPVSAQSGVDDTGEAEISNWRDEITASSKGAGQRTRHLFSHLFGVGKPFGKPTRALFLRDQWRGYLSPLIENAGLPLLPVERKAQKEEDGECVSHTEFQREMFSKAASRLAQVVTKQRQQEKDRQDDKAADQALAQMEADKQFADALQALRQYCGEYQVQSAASEEFRIGPRQIVGWEKVIKRWASVTEERENAVEARKRIVTEIQSDNGDEKFGDVNLFLRLAGEEYKTVWWHGGKTDASILQRFVAGMKARSDAVALKVAAYRHPDPYLNPVFCQFGVSRPSIEFRRIKTFSDNPTVDDPRAVRIRLWHPTEGCAKKTVVYGVSSRLDREIGSASDAVRKGGGEQSEVSRRGRLGAAAAGTSGVEAGVRVAGVFDRQRISRRNRDEAEDELKDSTWNGSLSTSRHDLLEIRRLLDKGKSDKAERCRSQLRWTLSVSMELQRIGPWFRYVTEATDRRPFLRTVRKDKPKDRNDASQGLAAAKGEQYSDLEGWPWHEVNKPLKENADKTALVEDKKGARGERASLILCRLPGLRVLSVDLGHRSAAACAVWESLSHEDFKREISARTIVSGGSGASDIYLHTRHMDDRGKQRITIYRRIGPDELGGSPHPAPWARLDRQFLIKLQGEERPARTASQPELAAVR